jgi:hypothetical protein
MLERLRKLNSQIKAKPKAKDYSQYRNDPIRFGEEVLGESYTDEVKALMESVRDNEITIAISANGTGKTHSAARIACWFKLCYGQDAQVLTAAAPPENNLKTILWGEIGSIVNKHPGLFDSYTITTLKIEDSPKSFILGLTIPSSGTPAEREAKFSGKHAPYLMFILDEGDAIPDEVYKGIESCMSGGIVVRLLIMFNPRQESGEVYRMIREKRANVVTLSAFAHPNVVTGENRIPGAVTRDTTVRRINQWCRPLAEGEQGKDFFILPAFLEGCTAKSPSGVMYPPLKPGKYEIVNSAFSYMSLGRYPAQSSRQLISREWINAARARWDSYAAAFGAVPPKGVRPIHGQDVAEFGDDENVALFRYGGWVEPVVTWSGMERYLVANRARDEYKARNAYRCNVDASGIGIGIAPTMTSDGCAAFSVFVGKPSKQKTELGEFGTIRDQLWWAVREWLQNDPGAMLPPDEMLIEELQCPTYKNDNRGKIKVMDKDTMREILKRSPDRADALCLTFAPSEQAFDPLDVDGCAV